MCRSVLKAAVLMASALTMASCVAQPAIQADTLKQYLVTIEDLPPGWIVSTPPERVAENYGQASDLETEFKNGNHVALHLVLAYSDAEKALDNYEHLVPAFLHVTTATVKPPYSPKGVNFSSGSAQESTLKCELLQFTPSEVCTYIAVYGNKVVVFNTHFTPEVMSADDLEKVLLRIEEKMQN